MNEPKAGVGLDAVQKTAKKINANIGKVLVGKEAAVELVLIALGCEGHLLIEDAPGTGKTMLARALAISLGLSFNRIQCTPDLLPSDITGMMVYNPKTAEFKFRPGPVMANIVLVDEINRATPRTQSSLLEAMEERQVTIDSETRQLPRPFLVLATENPVEFEGTFPLPEAQLDRFFLRLSLGYPSPAEEVEILARLEEDHPINSIGAVVTPDEIKALIQARRRIYVEESLRGYLVEIVTKTRCHPCLELGASPRGAISLFNASRMLAMLRGREYVIPDDIKYLAPYILGHRVITAPEATVRGVNGIAVIREIIDGTAAPTEVTLI
ncbi:MAG: MoxR family ATPase [Firmicutes bacterium]|nr:MoxR family ATPase [Bacillota bacterium]